MKALSDKGVIERVGSQKNGYWQIKKCEILHNRLVFKRKSVGYFYARIFKNSAENIHSWAGKEVNFMPYIAPEVVREANGLTDFSEDGYLDDISSFLS